ncbi:unnamed protein product [Jaminaea pallidilutea]
MATHLPEDHSGGHVDLNSTSAASYIPHGYQFAATSQNDTPQLGMQHGYYPAHQSVGYPPQMYSGQGAYYYADPSMTSGPGVLRSQQYTYQNGPHDYSQGPPQHQYYAANLQAQGSSAMGPYAYSAPPPAADLLGSKRHMSNQAASSRSPHFPAGAASQGSSQMAQSSASHSALSNSSMPRSPRQAHNSVNGTRMNHFVFPPQQQQGPQSQSQAGRIGDRHSSVPPSAGSSIGSGHGVSSLPIKPKVESAGGTMSVAPAAIDRAGARTAGWQQSTSASPLPHSSAASNSQQHPVANSQIFERLPTIPPQPTLSALPPSLIELSQGAAKQESSEQRRAEKVILDSSAQQYVADLIQAVGAYQARDEAMSLRMEALAFQPLSSWNQILRDRQPGRNMKTEERIDGDTAVSPETGADGAASVTGVRLLRKVVDLQRENEELGELLSQKLDLDGQGAGVSSAAPAQDVGNLADELKDAHTLIAAMSDALKEAEKKAARAEAALQVAVQSRSVGILEHSPQQQQKQPVQPPTSPPQSKPAQPNSSPATSPTSLKKSGTTPSPQGKGRGSRGRGQGRPSR